MLVNFVRLPNLYGMVLILLYAINKWSLRPVPTLVSTLPFSMYQNWPNMLYKYQVLTLLLMYGNGM